MRSQPFKSSAVTVPGGTGDLVSLSLPAGEARGVIIDNPSGSWLTLYPFYDLIPPYTLGWTRSFPYGVASITVRYTDGPTNQASSIEGQPMTVWLDSNPVAGSGGTAVPGSSYRPLATTTIDSMANATYIGLPIIVIPGFAGVRARIYSFRIGWAVADPMVSPLDMGFSWTMRPNPFPLGGQNYAFGIVSAPKYYDEAIFDVNPRDVPLGLDVTVVPASLWADGVVSGVRIQFQYHIRYSVV